MYCLWRGYRKERSIDLPIRIFYQYCGIIKLPCFAGMQDSGGTKPESSETCVLKAQLNVCLIAETLKPSLY